MLVPSLGSWSSVVSLLFLKRSCRPEHGSTVQHSSPPSLPTSPTRLAWVEKTLCVCICVCLRLGWLTATSFAYSRPLPSALLFSLSPAGTGNPQWRESNTNTEREREREKLADQGLVVTRASRLSILPPFLLTCCWLTAKALRASRRATLAHKEFHNSNSC